MIDNSRQQDCSLAPDPHSTIALPYVKGLITYLLDRNQDVDAFLSHHKLSLADLDDSGRRLETTRYQQMLLEAGRLCADPVIGLHVGEAIKASQYGALGYIAMSCERLGQVFDYHQHYEKLVSDRAISRYQAVGSGYCLTWDTGDTQLATAVVEENLASWVTFTRWITASKLSPEKITVQHSAPEDVSEYQRIFACPVLFEQPQVALYFPRNFLDIPISQHDPMMRDIMDSKAKQQLQLYAQQDGLLTDIRHILQKHWPIGEVKIEAVANQLGLTARTLQRRLQELGHSFQGVQDDTRKQLAHFYLCESAISLTELAFLLGFADQSAFQRAFKKWYQQTPGQYRKHCVNRR